MKIAIILFPSTPLRLHASLTTCNHLHLAHRRWPIRLDIKHPIKHLKPISLHFVLVAPGAHHETGIQVFVAADSTKIGKGIIVARRSEVVDIPVVPFGGAYNCLHPISTDYEEF